MFHLQKNVYVIAAVMALNFSVTSMMVLISGILGTAIAPNPTMGTLPAALLVMGTASATIPAAMWMKRVGRKRGMATGIVLAIVGAGLAYQATLSSHFGLLIVSMILLGFNAAFTQQGRFIILENSDGEQQQADGLTLGLLANLLAAVLGPWLGEVGRDLVDSRSGFAGSFLLAGGILVAALVALGWYQNRPTLPSTAMQSSRSLWRIVAQPVFIVAVGSAAIGYGVMSLLMTATPISMHEISGHTMQHTRWVIQSHIVAMFLPSIMTGYLLKRGFRVRLLFAGLSLYLLVVSIGFRGVEVLHYWWALVLLGVGWNFLFLTATALLPSTYNESEQFKAQAINDFVIFTTQALAAFGAGWLLFNLGWSSLLGIALAISLAWLFTLSLLFAFRLR